MCEASVRSGTRVTAVISASFRACSGLRSAAGLSTPVQASIRSASSFAVIR